MGIMDMAFGASETSEIEKFFMRLRTITDPDGGFTERRFASNTPPPPTIAKARTVITNGYEFAFNVVSSNRVYGYNIFFSAGTSAAVASFLDFVPQPPSTSRKSITYQHHTATAYNYWVASVSKWGKESARISITGTGAPTAPPSSGGGDGGGGGRGCPISGTKVKPLHGSSNVSLFQNSEWVEITTRGGRRLVASPTHPLITIRGQVPLSRVSVGDRIVSIDGEDEILSVKPRIFQGWAMRVSVPNGHLYWANGLLSHNLKAGF